MLILEFVVYFGCDFEAKVIFQPKTVGLKEVNPREKMLWAEWKRQLNIKLANQEKGHLQWKNKLKTTMHNVVIAMHRRFFFKFYSNCKLKNSKKHVCKVVVSALQTTLLGFITFYSFISPLSFLLRKHKKLIFLKQDIHMSLVDTLWGCYHFTKTFSLFYQIFANGLSFIVRVKYLY